MPKSNDNTQMEHWLHSRLMEEPTHDLAERIIACSRDIPQSSPAGFRRWLEKLFNDLHLPSPAYVFASALVIGILAGVGIPSASDTDVADMDLFSTQGFIYIQDDIL